MNLAVCYASWTRYKNIILEDVHLAIDFQHFYPCQNTSGMENYNYCTSLEPQQVGKYVPCDSNGMFVNCVGDEALSDFF